MRSSAQIGLKMRKLRFIFRVFSMVTSCVVVATAIFTTVLNPTDSISPMVLWQIPAVSMLCTLGCLIYPWDAAMTRKEKGIRIFLHYLYTNGVVLISGILFEWYSIKKIGNVISMVLTIAVIFAVVSGITWKRTSIEAQNMNKRLREYQQQKDGERS